MTSGSNTYLLWSTTEMLLTSTSLSALVFNEGKDKLKYYRKNTEITSILLCEDIPDLTLVY